MCSRQSEIQLEPQGRRLTSITDARVPANCALEPDGDPRRRPMPARLPFDAAASNYASVAVVSRTLLLSWRVIRALRKQCSKGADAHLLVAAQHLRASAAGNSSNVAGNRPGVSPSISIRTGPVRPSSIGETLRRLVCVTRTAGWRTCAPEYTRLIARTSSSLGALRTRTTSNNPSAGSAAGATRMPPPKY